MVYGAALMGGALLSMAGAGLTPVPAMASSAPGRVVAAPLGLFGNVRAIEEAGDLDGVEARFFRRDGRAMAEVTFCEGWCGMAYTLPLTRHGDGFDVTYDETTGSSRNGAPGKMTFVLGFTPVGKRLKLTMRVDGQSVDPGKDDRWLRPLARPFGLDVARHSMAACRRAHRCN